MNEIEAYCDKMAREYIKGFGPDDVCKTLAQTCLITHTFKAWKMR